MSFTVNSKTETLVNELYEMVLPKQPQKQEPTSQQTKVIGDQKRWNWREEKGSDKEEHHASLGAK